MSVASLSRRRSASRPRASAGGPVRGPHIEWIGQSALELGLDGWDSNSPHQVVTVVPPFAPSICVWSLSASSDERVLRLGSILSDTDRQAAGEHSSPLIRRRSLASRILLRLALAQETDWSVSAADWCFSAGEYGKPAIGAGFPEIHFSISHNEWGSVVATSREAPVGVDIEALDGTISATMITSFCASVEIEALKRMSNARRARAFLKLWTLKEAYSKMLGTGLSADFAALAFSSRPLRLAQDEDVRFLSWERELDGRVCQISLASLPLEAAMRRGSVPHPAIIANAAAGVARSGEQGGQ